MNTKTCSCCKVEKTTDNFSKNKNYKDGLNYYCKPCAKEKIKASRDKNPEKYKDYHKNYYQNNKAKAKNYGKQYYQKKKNIWNNYQIADNPYVYRIKHKKTGEYYIGCSKQRFANRIVKHFSTKSCTNSPFTGKNKNHYDIDILCFCRDKKQARRIEKDLLATRVGIDPNCLNKMIGGK